MIIRITGKEYSAALVRISAISAFKINLARRARRDTQRAAEES